MTYFAVKVFRASNFLEFMWPSFAIAQLFGLFPYKIRRGKLLPSIPGYVFAGCILTGLSYIVGKLVYKINLTKELEFDSLPAVLQTDCYVLLGYSHCIASFLFSNHKLKVYEKLSEISWHVDKVRWNVVARFIHAKDLLGFFFLIGQMPNTLKGKASDIFVKVVCSYLTLVIYLLDNQFVNCVIAVRLSFRSMNSGLISLEEKIMSTESGTVGDIRAWNDGGRSHFLAEIRSLRKRYEDLCAIVKTINDAFALPIIVSVALTFAEVTFSLYFYILKCMGIKDINLEKQVWYYYFITSITYYTSKFLVGVWVCETVKDEAQKCKIIVHRILTRLNDREISYELQSFSLQMVQRNISFSVHGIALDGSLVTGIASGISTYLLILIQFLITSHKCKVDPSVA